MPWFDFVCPSCLKGHRQYRTCQYRVPKFCSVACRAKAQIGRKPTYDTSVHRTHGPTHQSWRGGFMVDQHGYRLLRVTMPDGSRGYEFEHRLVMAKHLGRALTPSDIVHHINHARDDNRLANLALTTRADHHRDHHPEKYSKWRNRWSVKWNACRDCGSRDKSGSGKHNAGGYCVKCYATRYAQRRG